MGRSHGIRTRRYHALLLAATPAARRAHGAGQRLSRCMSRPPAGRSRCPRIATPATSSIPTARPRSSGLHRRAVAALGFCCPDGTQIACELRWCRRAPCRTCAWRSSPGAPARLRVRPLLAARDYHATASREPRVPLRGRERAATPRRGARYDGVPAIVCRQPGRYEHDPTGIATSTTPRRARAGSTARRTWPRPAICTFDLAAGHAPGVRAMDRPTADATPSARARAPRRRSTRAGRRAYLVARGAGTHDHRRLSVVLRLGPRHVHLAARAVPRAGALPRRRRRDPAASGRRASSAACCRTASPSAAPRPSTTPSTPRSGS